MFLRRLKAVLKSQQYFLLKVDWKHRKNYFQLLLIDSILSLFLSIGSGQSCFANTTPTQSPELSFTQMAIQMIRIIQMIRMTVEVLIGQVRPEIHQVVGVITTHAPNEVI